MEQLESEHSKFERERLEYEKFRWQRQKFMLTLFPIMFAALAIVLAVYFQMQQQIRSEEYSDAVLKEATTSARVLEIRNFELESRISSLENKLSAIDSLLSVVRDNQKAQEILVRDAIERSNNR